MKEKNAAMETDSIKEHDFTVWDFTIEGVDEIFATFALESGGLVVNNCWCFYKPNGDLKFRLPGGVVYERQQEDPTDRIVKKLCDEIEKLKARDPNRNNSIPFD
jgi:hypothetical protein